MVRERSIALISAWVHQETQPPPLVFVDVDPREVAIDAALVASALVLIWADTLGITPEQLLADIALGQAVERELDPL